MRSDLPVIIVCAVIGLAIMAWPGFAQDEAPDASSNAADISSNVADTSSDQGEVAAEAPKRDCHVIGVTWDGGSKRMAQNAALGGLRDSTRDWRRKRGRNSGWLSENVTVEPYRLRPNPYWRKRVTPDLYYRPNLRTKTAYVVCWKGVISVAVCTAGTKVCK